MNGAVLFWALCSINCALYGSRLMCKDEKLSIVTYVVATIWAAMAERSWIG